MAGRKYCPIETVLNIYETRYWYSIPGFRGYEISNDHYIRSMKHFNKYPFGIMLTPKKKDANNPVFELSDDFDKRISMSLNEIIELVRKSPVEPGYPRGTIVTNRSSRNLKIVKNQNKSNFSPTNKYHMVYDPIHGLTYAPNTDIGEQ